MKRRNCSSSYTHDKSSSSYGLVVGTCTLQLPISVKAKALAITSEAVFFDHSNEIHVISVFDLLNRYSSVTTTSCGYTKDGGVEQEDGSKLSSTARRWIEVDDELAEKSHVLSLRPYRYVCSSGDKLCLLTLDNSVVQYSDRGEISKICSFNSDDVIYIACNDQSLRVIRNGCLLNETFDDSLFRFPADLKSFDAGRDFFVVLLSNGTVYTFGNGLRGQMGNGEADSVNVPAQVDFDRAEADESIKYPMRRPLFIDEVVCGGWHVWAMDKRNCNTYAWGWNADGQIGRLDSIGACQFRPLRMAGLGPVQRIWCGHRHSWMKMKASGALVSMGSNHMGQCGLPFSDCVNGWSGEALDPGEEVVMCGGAFTLTLSQNRPSMPADDTACDQSSS